MRVKFTREKAMKPTILAARLGTTVFAECDFTSPKEEASITQHQLERIIKRTLPFLMEVETA
jgi:hypothetical protein